MKRISGPMGKGIVAHSRFWRWLLIAGLSLSLLVACFSLSARVSPPVFAASSLPLAHFTSSPTQGPVGAVITVTGANLRSGDGTQIDLGYSTNFSDCNAATDTQPGIVKNHAFSGWLRWPANTGTGSFEVCASVHDSGNPFMVGMYRVLSATPPQIALTTTTPSAGKQVTVTGTNFLPAGTSVTLVWPAANGLPGASLGSVSSDETGAFSQTFTVPPHAITGTYSVVATAGAAQPPTLSASTSFHVKGITIVAMPTPTASPVSTATPTLVATATPSTNTTLGTNHTTNTNGTSDSGMLNSSSILLPIGLIGLVIIVAALLAGVYVVRKQRALAPVAPASAGGSPISAWSGNDGFAPAAIYQASPQPPPDNPVLARLTRPHKAVAPVASRSQKPIPFDPVLAEAMRQAQVSLFATPRPPVGEEVPS